MSQDIADTPTETPAATPEIQRVRVVNPIRLGFMIGVGMFLFAMVLYVIVAMISLFFGFGIFLWHV